MRQRALSELVGAIAEQLRASGRQVVRAGIDGFHRPRAQRYRRGHDSVIGCYQDTYDHGALRRVLLDPLGPGGDRRYRTEVFDLVTGPAPLPRPGGPGRP